MPGRALCWCVEKLLCIADLVWIFLCACPLPKRDGERWYGWAVLHHISHWNGFYYSFFFSLMYLSYTTSLQDRVALLFSTLVNGQLRCRDSSSASAISVPSILKVSLRWFSGYMMEFYVNLSLAIFIAHLPTALNIFYIQKGLQQSSRKSYFS